MRHVFLYCILLTLCCLLPVAAVAQFPHNAHPDYYDTPAKRLLAFYASNYIYTACQGRIDPDSATRIATTIYELHPLLPYNELYNPEANSKAGEYIRAGRIQQALALAGTQHGEDQWTTLADLANHYLYKPGAATPDLDSAKLYIDQLDAATRQKPAIDKWPLTVQHLLGAYYYQQRNLAESQKHFTAAVATCRKAGTEADIARVLLDQASHLPFGTPGKDSLLLESLTRFKKNNMPIKQIEALGGLIREHFRTNVNLAKTELLQMLELENAIGFKHHQNAHNSLSYLYMMTSEYVKALTHAKLAIEDAEATGEVLLTSAYYGRMSSIYANMESLQAALEWNEKALNCCVRNHQTALFWYNRFFERANWLLALKRPEEALKLIKEITAQYPPTTPFDQMYLTLVTGGCYQMQRDFKKAQKHYEQFLAISSQIPPHHLHMEFTASLFNIAFFYVNRGNFAPARQIMNRIRQSPMLTRSATNELSLLELLQFKLDSAAGNYLGAISHYKGYKTLHDTLQSLSQRKKIAELSVQYESEKKDQDIKLLTQQNDQANFARNITLGGIAMLLVIVGLLYSRYRVKQRSNAQLEEKQIQISQKNTTLEHLLNEKEWLLKEIHHRVKNNLQMVMSLLSSQATYLDKDALAAIQDGQHRVYAMSLIHQKLYNTQNVTSIDMSIYLHELVTYLQDSFKSTGRILFKLTVTPAELDVTQAIPLGLIVNEAITNSLKHAFPAGREGTITLTLVQDQDILTLTVADDGVGVPEGHSNGKHASFGMKLIAGLARELDGTLMLRNTGGATVSITFALERLLQSKPANEAATV